MRALINAEKCFLFHVNFIQDGGGGKKIEVMKFKILKLRL